MVAWNDFNLSLTNPINVSDRLVQSDGSVPYPANTIVSTDSPHQVDIAYDLARDEYPVAYVKAFSAVPPRTANDICGARLRWDGAVTRSDYPIITWLKNQNAPALATNNTGSYMLVFQTMANDDPEYSDNDIYRQEINATTDDPIDGASMLSSSANDDTNPDVVAGSG